MNLELHKRNKAKVAEVKELMTKLVDATNAMGMEEQVAQGMFEGLVESHRTLQNSFMRSFVMSMKEYSQVRTDARNQGAVELAKVIAETESNIPFI